MRGAVRVLQQWETTIAEKFNIFTMHGEFFFKKFCNFDFLVNILKYFFFTTSMTADGPTTNQIWCCQWWRMVVKELNLTLRSVTIFTDLTQLCLPHPKLQVSTCVPPTLLNGCKGFFPWKYFTLRPHFSIWNSLFPLYLLLRFNFCSLYTPFEQLSH